MLRIPRMKINQAKAAAVEGIYDLGKPISYFFTILTFQGDVEEIPPTLQAPLTFSMK